MKMQLSGAGTLGPSLAMRRAAGGGLGACSSMSRPLAAFSGEFSRGICSSSIANGLVSTPYNSTRTSSCKGTSSTRGSRSSTSSFNLTSPTGFKRGGPTVSSSSSTAISCSGSGGLATARRYFAAARRAPHEILGVKPDASPEECKKAYKKKALQYHPDRNPDDREAAEKKFKEISEAYDAMTNPSARGGFGGAASNGTGFHSGAARGGGMPGARQMTPEEAERMFQQMFGGGFHDVFSRMFQGLDDAPSNVVRMGDRLSVIENRRAIEQYCRARGIDSVNDDLRARCMGKTGQVVKMDAGDNTVKLRFDDLASKKSSVSVDAWFPAEALVKQVDKQGADPFRDAQRFNGFHFGQSLGSAAAGGNIFGGGGFGGGGGVGGAADVISEETYTQVVQGPNGSPQLKVITVRKKRDGTTERIIQTQPI
ncbi:unnamed protein product [Amoebophrya sp. A25]|nr:unnamed protein product [Amoebophrya sp. A25]|eukprot:GSA25T00000960001.1